jgi:hypothetical protein
MMQQPQNMGGDQQAQPNEIKSKLLMLLSQAAQIAQQNGIDFGQLLQEFMSKSGRGQTPPPPPPSPR